MWEIFALSDNTIPKFKMLYKLVKATITKYHILGGLNNKNLFSHNFGDQPVSRVDFLRGLSLRLVDACVLPVSSHHLFSLHVSVLISCSFRDTSYIKLGPTLIASFYLNFVLQTLSHSEVLRVRIST